MGKVPMDRIVLVVKIPQNANKRQERIHDLK